MFSDEFIEALPEDAYEAARLLCSRFYETDSKVEPGHETNDTHYFSYIKAHGIFQGFVEAYNLPIEIPPLVDKDRKTNTNATRALALRIKELAEGEFVKTTAQAARLKFAT